MTEMPIREGAHEQAAWHTDPPMPVAEESSNLLFWQVMLLGLVTVLFGIVVLAWPHVSVHLLGILTGLWLLVGGAARIVAAFVYWRGTGWQVLSGITGVLFLVAGVACLRDIAKGVATLAFVIALVWLCVGMVEFVAAAEVSGRPRTWRVVLGIAATVVGLVFLLWPGPSLGVLVVLAGFSALVVGVVEIAFAVQLRRSRSRA